MRGWVQAATVMSAYAVVPRWWPHSHTGPRTGHQPGANEASNAVAGPTITPFPFEN